MNYSKEINGHILEYYDDDHLYLVDGIRLPSVTQLVNAKFGDSYQGVPRSVLDNAAEQGTLVHKAIEEYCTEGKETPILELRNFKFLQRQYGFEVLENEVPVILFENGKPVATGRLDMVLKMYDQIGGADIKRMASLSGVHKEKVTTQLNLYRIAYRQSYGAEWRFLKAIQLKDDKRRFLEIPINERCAWDAVKSYKEQNNG